MTAPGNTRDFNGLAIPTPGKFELDPAHTRVSFVARHMMVSKVRGGFTSASGSIVVAENPLESHVDVTIDAASIDTGDATRDEHLRSEEFLDVAHYPEIRYRSTRVRPGDGNKWAIDGMLTVRAVTREVVLSVEFCGAQPDPWGNLRAGFLANTEIDREDFDITWNQILESGGFLVGKGVRIEIDAELVRESESAA
jgi:polyisoprenoid-binding protein YceI